LRIVELGGLDFTGANLSHAILSGKMNALKSLIAINLNGAKLHRTDLTNTDLTRARMRGAELIKAICECANMSSVDMTGAVLTGAIFKRTVLIGATTTNADFQDVDIGEAFHDIDKDTHEIESLEHQNSLKVRKGKK